MKRLLPAAMPIVALLAVLSAVAAWRYGDSGAHGAKETSRTAAVAAAAVPADAPSGTAAFGGPFSLTDQDGRHRSDADFRGKYMLVFFGYTYCPDICPTALAVEAQALDMLGARAKQIAPIFITVDPGRDTPQKLKSYLAAFDADAPSARPAFVGLTGSADEIAKVAKAYRVYYQAHIDGLRIASEDYSVDHTSETYLMSPEGKFVAYYSIGITPEEMAADLMRKLPPG